MNLTSAHDVNLLISLILVAALGVAIIGLRRWFRH
jgi:hypothetical protein